MERKQLGSLGSRAPSPGSGELLDMKNSTSHPPSGEMGAAGWGATGRAECERAVTVSPGDPGWLGFLVSVTPGRSPRTCPSPNPSILFSRIQQGTCQDPALTMKG